MPDATRHTDDRPAPQRMLTFASGGWVLLLMGLFILLLIGWAVAPAILRTFHRPPGDGEHIESYRFDLSNLTVPRELIAPIMLYRDMVPVMTKPTATGPDEGADASHRWATMQNHNDPKYSKYLVSGDLVIGVEMNGEARAYPISVMYVHEIINDELGGVPIAVTFNWPCDSVVVFDRRIAGGRGGVAEFAVSGLVYNSNLLMYDRNEVRGGEVAEGGAGGESLWCQLLAKPISGQAAASHESLRVLRAERVTWGDWQARHPQTTALDRNLGMTQRYKDAVPTQYLQSQELLSVPVKPLPPASGYALKTPVLAISIGSARRVYPLPLLVDEIRAARYSDEPEPSLTWRDSLGGVTVRFIADPKMQTVRVDTAPTDEPFRVTHASWFAWHAMYPEDELANGTSGASAAGP